MIQRMRKRQNINSDRRKNVDRQEAFAEFKDSERGQELQNSIKESRNEIKDKRTILKTKTNECNEIKHQIDKVKNELDRKIEKKKQDAITQQMTPGLQSHMHGFDLDEAAVEGAEIIDEEELALIKELKSLKK